MENATIRFLFYFDNFLLLCSFSYTSCKSQRDTSHFILKYYHTFIKFSETGLTGGHFILYDKIIKFLGGDVA